MGANSSEQRPGEGARFLIDFPAATVDVSALLSELPPTASRGELVLSWKMNPTVAQLIAEMLSDLG